jgi:predicted ArsR family transcriptional regulator
MTTDSGREDRADLDAIGALVEPSRRALYDYVTRQRTWVTREDAAAGVGLQRGIAAHHLDRLAAVGLLEVDYQRQGSRSGPGAGRPAKVYRRSAGERGASLPPRRYVLAGRLLAEAADRSRKDGIPIEQAIDRAARDEGHRIGATARRALGRRTGGGSRRAVVLGELRLRGFEPETQDDGVVVLHNCPFHLLAAEHTELICGMNLCMLEGTLAELGDTGLKARLEPAGGFCCVRLQPIAPGPAPGRAGPLAKRPRAPRRRRRSPGE